MQILDPKRKIIVLRHPYREDCVVLPTRNTTRPDTKSIERDVTNRLNLLLEKYAWLSAGLVWMKGASESGSEGVFEESGPDGLESRPTINLFEQWEEGRTFA